MRRSEISTDIDYQPPKGSLSSQEQTPFPHEAHRFYQRKVAKTNKIITIKALSNKLARATYYVMRDQVAYDAAKLFG